MGAVPLPVESFAITAFLVGGDGEAYSRPRHHMDEPVSSSFFGSGSQKYCTMRL